MIADTTSSSTHDSDTDPFVDAMKIEEPVHVWNGSIVSGADDTADGPGCGWEEVGVDVDGGPPKWDACQSPMKQRVEVVVEEKVVNLDCRRRVGEYNIELVGGVERLP